MGWYGSFALEAMSLGKPTLCYLDERLKDKFCDLGYPEPPLINTSHTNIYEKLKMLVKDGMMRKEIGSASRRYVKEVGDIRHIAQKLKDLYENL
jgi:hypothetical protein